MEFCKNDGKKMDEKCLWVSETMRLDKNVWHFKICFYKNTY